MGRVEKYPAIIKEILNEMSKYPPSHGNIETWLLFDDEHQSYQLMYLGWDGPRRVHNAIIHIRLREDKIWIEYDGTQEGIASALLAAGVPKNDIVLAFHSPEKRKYTEFAVT